MGSLAARRLGVGRRQACSRDTGQAVAAYFGFAHSPGGFRIWWRRLHGDSEEHLDNAHLMRMAGRFARRLRAAAKANGIPVIDCKQGERKHLIAYEYLAPTRSASDSS